MSRRGIQSAETGFAVRHWNIRQLGRTANRVTKRRPARKDQQRHEDFLCVVHQLTPVSRTLPAGTGKFPPAGSVSHLAPSCSVEGDQFCHRFCYRRGLQAPLKKANRTQAQIPKNPVKDWAYKNGAKETRTPDPLHAMRISP